MDKRIEKRRKRELARAKKHVKLSEPDVRTPEEIKAAREASKASFSRGGAPVPRGPASSFRGGRAPTKVGPAKTDA